jgi:hypothetical protein
MVYVRIIFIIYTFLLPNVSARLFCRSEGDISPLTYQDSNANLELVDFIYSPPPYLDSVSSCAGHLSAISENNYEKMKLISLMGDEQLPKARIKGNKKKFYQTCLDSQYCQIRWPYILSYPSLYYRWAYKYLSSSSDACYKHRNPLPSQETFSLNNLIPLKKNITWWRMPETDIVTETIRLAKEGKFEHIIIAAMTVSLDSLKDLTAHLQNKNSHITILVDQQLQTLRQGFTAEVKKLPTNIKIVFVPRSPLHPDTFHFKSVLLEKSAKGKPDHLLWISPNWHHSQIDRPLHDIGFTTTNFQLIHEIKQRLMIFKKTACLTEIQWSDCHISIRESSARQQDYLKSIRNHGCSEDLLSLNVSFPFSSVAEQYSYDFSKFKNTVSLLNWIKEAKKEIIIQSHIISDGSFFKELIQFKISHPEITIIIRSGKPMEESLIKKFKRNNIIINENYHIEVHSKYILRDREFLFLTSANFTTSGLDNPSEIGFLFSSSAFPENFINDNLRSR